MFEQEWERLLEGLAEAGSHEAVDYRVDRRVGVGHAVGPGLDLVGGVVGPVVRREGLKEDEELNGTPAHCEEKHNHHHHLGDFPPDADGPLRQQVHLRRRSGLKNLLIISIK